MQARLDATGWIREWSRSTFGANHIAVRLVSGSARVDDPVRVTVGGVEIEGLIEGVESSTLHVRVGPQRASQSSLATILLLARQGSVKWIDVSPENDGSLK